MLNLICGIPGSGKTSSMVDAIREDILCKRKCFYLVPEQEAYVSERDLPAVLPENAGLYFEVVNFSRLADKVFTQFGGRTDASVSPGMRTVLMWDTLRALSPVLRLYNGGSAKDMALTSLLLSTVDELRANGVGSAELESAAKTLPNDSVLQKKLLDLSAIDAAFREKLQSRMGCDPSDKLYRMAEKLSEHRCFADCRFYVDSFTGFTAQEYSVLRELIRQSESVTVALPADSFHSELPQFETCVKTARKLSKIASDVGTETQRKELPPPVGIPPVFGQLERRIWNFHGTGAKIETSAEDRERVLCVTSENLYEESEAAAYEILRLLDQGYRCGDVAVYVRDPETYRGILDAAFERHSIPYFLSERTDLSSHPLSKLILSALRCVSRNYRLTDVMTLVKTGLCGVDLTDASLFEEYCETWHISGSRFLDDVWSMNPDGLTTERSERGDRILDAANRTRRAVILPLSRFAADLGSSDRLDDRCRAVYRYLCGMGIPEILSDRAKRELAAGMKRSAGETVRLYRFLTDSMTELCRLIPDSRLTVDEFFSVLSLLFSNMDMGSVPNLHDCVTIGSAVTLRADRVRCSMLLGLCDGEFPQSIRDEGVLNESDKIAMEECGIILDSDEKTRFSNELFYVYRALTKPTDRIWLSTVSKNADGSAKAPSIAFLRVRNLLGLEVHAFSADRIRKSQTPAGEDVPEGDASLVPYPDGTSLFLSQTSIRTFALCPYQYYCTYRLHLRERKDSAPSYADDGLFLHYVFEHFLSASLTPEGKLSLPSSEKLEEEVDGIVRNYLDSVCPFPPERMDMSVLHLFSRLRKMALVMLGDMAEELRQSGFVPRAFEQKIGGKNGNGLPPVEIHLNNGNSVTLTGQIDRLDVCKENGKTYFRVVDYKSGTHQFRLADVRTGEDIQLVLYLYAVLCDRKDGAVGAGAQYLYYDRSDAAVARSGFCLDEAVPLLDPDGKHLKGLKQMSSDDIADMQNDFFGAVKDISGKILSGMVSKTPSEDSCKYCIVKDCCDKCFRK